MRLLHVEKKAKDLGIKDTWKHPRKKLIKMIQKAEGSFVCFGTARNGRCEQITCCWRADCL